MLNEFRSSMVAESQRRDYIQYAEHERLSKSIAGGSSGRSSGQVQAAIASLASVGLILILALVF